MLLRSDVQHTIAIIRGVLRHEKARIDELSPGLLDVTGRDLAMLIAALADRLSTTEAAEVRVADIGGLDATQIISASLGAPTLAQAAARVSNVDLLQFFSDEAHHFRSVYQPIVEMTRAGPGGVVGYEALLRAQGDGGPIGAPQLFDAAAAAGWLNVLDRVGRTTALRDAEGWLGDRVLFVNFLPTTIYRPEVCLRTTEQAAKAAGISLDKLVFEVTESERVADLDHLEKIFAYYRHRGCRVALDDLGAGYSSLNLLVRLQPDVVKLDREIVTRLPGKTASAVVTAVTDIVHGYGGLVLAECVETDEQAEAACALDVDLGQGWLFGRPLEPNREVDAESGRARRVDRLAIRESGGDVAVGVTGSYASVRLPNEPGARRSGVVTIGTESATRRPSASTACMSGLACASGNGPP
jgi:EAL domain-containing protein (putative c-di-GMP-specific phosphodiesterase class I)